MKIFRFTALFAALLTAVSCVPGSDGEFDDIYVGKLPLKTGNRWIYSVSGGYGNFSDSAEVFDFYPYNIDGVTVKSLYQYKDIALTPEQLTGDTVWVRLLEYESDRLLHFGNEKRDRSESHFPFGNTEMLSSPAATADHFNPYAGILFSDEEGFVSAVSAEEFHIAELPVFSGNSVRIITDSTLNCIKTRNVKYQTAFMSGKPYYDLYLYYTDLGIIKIAGSVNGASFNAELKKCKLN